MWNQTSYDEFVVAVRDDNSVDKALRLKTYIEDKLNEDVPCKYNLRVKMGYSLGSFKSI